MRACSRLLASATEVGPSKPFRPTPMALLPPIPLYRRLLRAHRKLPVEERTLGDMYVKAEFKAHKDIDNPVHIVSLVQVKDWHSTDFNARLASLLNGSCMPRLLKGMHGRMLKWTKRRLTR